MSYSAIGQALGQSLGQSLVQGGCQPAEYRTVFVDDRGASVGLGPCTATCAGLETVTSDGKQCTVVGTPPPAAETPISWSPFVLAGAAALAFVIVLR